MSTSTLTNLQIVSTTVKLSDNETRRKYSFARSKGVIKCPTGKVMFLGDRGVGKTCTKRMLLGKEHIPEHVSTLGIKNHVTETKQVNEDWKEISGDSLKDYENSELKRAFAYFCAFVDNHVFIQSVSEKFKDKILNIIRFLVGIMLVTFLCYLMTLDDSSGFHFTPVLVSCTIGLYLSTNNMVLGFNIGNGLAMVFVFVYFWTMQTNSLLVSWLPNVASRLIVLACLSGFAGWLIGFLLALGIGAGVSIALCLMQHKPEIEELIFTSNESPSGLYPAAMFMVFTVSLMIGIFAQSLVLQRLSKWVSNFIAPIVFILSIMLAKAFTDGLTVIHFYLSGFLFGTAFTFGQVHGRSAAWKLSIGHTNRILTDVIGIIVGVIFGYCLAWTVPQLNWWFVVGLFGVLFCIVCEVHRYNISRRDVVPVGLIRKMKNEGQKDWPTKLHILDCAGNSIYHNTHHIFMSRNSIYLVVFRLDHLKDHPEECNERILYWLNSVIAHARHIDSKVFLIATHKMRVPDADERQRLLTDLSKSLKGSFSGRLVKNTSKNHYVFSVENDEREHNDEDVQLLKSAVWDSAMQAEYTVLPNRVTWFAFLDKIRELKSKTISGLDSCGIIQSCQTLWELVKDDCRLAKDTDFYRMLRYFNDCGEIYYDSRDPVLCRYVILDPQLLVDVVSALLQCEAAVQNLPSHLERDHEELHTKGVVTFRLLSHYLDKFELDHRKLVQLLKSLDILIPLTLTSGLLVDDSDKYVVTFMLPLRRVEYMNIKNPDRVVIFDFGYFYPEPVFLRLLAKCYQMSFSTTKEYDLRITEDNIFMSKDKGIFYFADGIQYCVQLFRPHSKKNQIWIQIRAIKSEYHTPDIYDFIQQMDSLMQRICKRYFEFLEYKYLMVCDCSMADLQNDLSDIPPEVDTITIVDYSKGNNQNLESFPKSSKTYICRRDVNKIVRFNPNTSCDVNRIRKDVDYTIPGLQERVDAFISCCPQDRIFVQTDLVPFLENETRRTFGIKDSESVSVLVNYYDNPNADGSHWTAQAINKELIKQSRCVIAVCSLNYLKSVELKDAQSAILENIPVVPVYIQSIEPPLHFSTLGSIHYPTEPELLTIDFYIPLIKTVRLHCDRGHEPETKSGLFPKMMNIFSNEDKNTDQPVIL